MSADGWSLAASGLGFIGGERTNVANARMARAQMDFQERMSSTAHQREVADLRAAGLNPILSGTGGMGSSTPGGSTATMQNSVATALDARRQQLEADNMRATNRNITEDSDLKRKLANLASVDYNVRLWDADLRNQQLKTERERTASEFWSAASAREAYSGHRLEGEIDREGTGDVSRRLRRFLGPAPATSAFSAGRFRVRP